MEQAGNWGNWMVGSVPEKANWVLQFIQSVTATAPATAIGGEQSKA